MANEGQATPPATTKDPGSTSERAQLRWPQWLSIAAVSALVSVAGGAIGLVFALRPGWRPDPGEKQLARAAIVATERGVSIADYTKRIGHEVPSHIGAPHGLSTNDRLIRCLPGDIYYVQQNLEGFKDRDTSITPFTYDDKTKLRLRGAFPTVSGTNFFNIKHSRTSDQSVVPVWVQWPYRQGRYFVRFEIFHKDAFLTLIDAQRFKMTFARYNSFVTSCFNKTPP
jgi:hypothetical protein